MTEGGRGRMRGTKGNESVGGGRSDGPEQEAWGCLYVYVTSQPQPACTDGVQTQRLYQGFVEQPLGTHCLPAQRLPTARPTLLHERHRKRAIPTLAEAPPRGSGLDRHWRLSVVQKRKNYLKYAFRLTSQGLIMGKEDYLCLCIMLLLSVALEGEEEEEEEGGEERGGQSKPPCMSFTPHRVLIELSILSLFWKRCALVDSAYDLCREHLMEAESLALRNDGSLDTKPHQSGSHSFSFFHFNLFKRPNYTI